MFTRAHLLRVKQCSPHLASILVCSKWFFPFAFIFSAFYIVIMSLMSATSFNLILLDLLTLVIFYLLNSGNACYHSLQNLLSSCLLSKM
jgi:hypothetical protein